jgi:DNA-binding SARP family transcriptional activator/WD40 repeat protein
MRIEVLGPLAVDGEPPGVGPRERVVLAALATRLGEPVDADLLADALWGDGLPPTWTKVIQGCVSRLRKQLGVDAIQTLPHAYRLALPAEDVDAARFEAAASRTRELLALHDPDRAAYVADTALALWRGRPLPELDGWEPGRREADRLEELRRDLEELHLDALVRAGRTADVLGRAPSLVDEAPLRERRWGLLALAQYQQARQGEALETLRLARTTLREGLGIDVNADLRELEERILRQDPELAATEPPEVSTVCPYLGLVPYGQEDADRFFGRQRDIDAGLDRLARTGVLAVVGPSGSGKSSLVRAGLAATLARAGRRVIVVTPGDRPTDALTVLPSSGRQPVLVVDQCEEVFAPAVDPTDRDTFLAALVEHATAAPLVVAMRADRVGALAATPAFAAAIEPGLHVLTRMSESDLRDAIEGPARQAGLRLEPGLVDLLVREVEDEPGALPLLSHALRQTWIAREGRTLTVAGYRSSGGIRGAVARTAEQVYGEASDDERRVLRDLLLRLVVPSPEGEPVRSRVSRRTLETDDAHVRLIERLVGARLLTSDEDRVEVAHEALTRAWPRLRAWLDDDVDGQRILRHLIGAADSWDAMGQPTSELYRGVRLERALDWRRRSAPDLRPVEAAFLEESERQAAAEAEAGRRRRRALVSVLGTAAAVSLVLGAAAVLQARDATAQRDLAIAAEVRAEAAASQARGRGLLASSLAVADADPALAKLLAVTAAGDGSELGVEELALLHRLLAADRVQARYTWPHAGEAVMLETDVHPAGDRLVAAGSMLGPSGTIEVHDLATDAAVWSHEVGDGRGIVGPRFASDGERVVAGVVDLTDGEEDPGPVGVHVWDAASGDLETVVDVGPCGGWVDTVAGSRVSVVAPITPPCSAFLTEQRHVLVVDLADGTITTIAEDALERAPLSEDGQRLAFTDRLDRTIVVVEVEDTTRIAEIDADAEGFVGVDGAVWYVKALDADGSRVLSGGRRVAVWDVETGELVTTFAGHAGESADDLIAADGRTAFTAGRDGGLLRWDLLRGDQVARYPAVGGARMSRTADGRLLATVPNPRGAVLLDLTPSGEVWHVPTCGGSTLAWTLEAAGAHVVSSEFCPDEGVITFVVDRDTREEILALPRHDGQDLALSPDGTRFLRQENEGDREEIILPPRVRDATTGELVMELEGVCRWDWEADPVDAPGCARFPELPAALWNNRLHWSPDGAAIAAVRNPGSGGPGVMVWDAEDGRLRFTEPDCLAHDVAFRPDGEELLLSCVGRLVAVSVQDGAELRAADVDLTVEQVAFLSLAGFSADSRTILAVGEGDRGASVHWIDAETLEPTRSVLGAHDGGPKSWAMDTDRARLATGSADGSVKVWDVATGTLVHEFHLGATQVQGLAFVGGEHLAVATEHGGISVYTLDPGELLDLVRASLRRGFTPAECERYGMADACPTLDDLRTS